MHILTYIWGCESGGVIPNFFQFLGTIDNGAKIILLNSINSLGDNFQWCQNQSIQLGTVIHGAQLNNFTWTGTGNEKLSRKPFVG